SKSLKACRCFWPVIASDMFIQRLTSAKAQREPTRVHCLQGGGRLGENGWMVAPARWGYAGHKAKVCCLAEGAEPTPDKCRMPLRWNPGMEMIAGGYNLEIVLFSQLAVFQQIRWVKLL